MQLTDPAYLWALLGLLIPLAIHLLSRKAGRVVKVGSIRHLTDSNTRKFSSLRFNEYALFLLRTLSVVLLVLILAGLTKRAQRTVPRWVLVEGNPAELPGLAGNIDSLEADGYEIRYLASEFPLIDDGPPPQVPLNYPYLIKRLETQGVKAIVYAQNRLSAFRGRQRPLPEKISWLQLAGRGQDTVLRALRLGGDTVQVQSVSSTADRTAISRRHMKIPFGQDTLLGGDNSTQSIPIEPLPPLQVLLLSGESLPRAATLMEAAIRALGVYTGRKVVIEKSADFTDSTRTFDGIIGFGPTVPTLSDNGKFIQVKNGSGPAAITQMRSDRWVIKGVLNRQNILRKNLLVALSQILFSDAKLTQQIQQWDERTIDESIFFNGAAEALEIGRYKVYPLLPWLIAALLLVFIFERILAFYRRA